MKRQAAYSPIQENKRWGQIEMVGRMKQNRLDTITVETEWQVLFQTSPLWG